MIVENANFYGVQNIFLCIAEYGQETSVGVADKSSNQVLEEVVGLATK